MDPSQREISEWIIVDLDGWLDGNEFWVKQVFDEKEDDDDDQDKGTYHHPRHHSKQ